MANPQKEDGYTALANEIWDALARYRLSGEEWKCLIVIFRKTYGWKKKSDRIALSQFSKMTDMKRQNVARALKSLSSKRIICVIKTDYREALEYRFNKDFDEWVPVIKKDACNQNRLGSVIKIDNQLSSKVMHTKETLTKETIQKKKDINIFSDHLLEVLKIPMSDKGKTEALLKTFGLEVMIYCVDRMKLYFDEVKKNKWTNYVIGKHWRNLYEKLEYFSSDENLYNKLQDTERANSKKTKVDCRTVSTDFSSDEEIMRKQREKKND